MRSLFIFLLIVGCSTPNITGKTKAEVLYREALTYVEKDRFLLAIEKLNHIKSKHPYSYYATHAELLHADILFKQESYVEAQSAYTLFRDMHPKHEKLDYVIWKIAESYFLQLPSTIDRDLSMAVYAKKHYWELLRKYPGSKHNKGAKEKIEKCNRMLTQSEQYVADFYFKTKNYEAANYRYQYILDHYKDELMRKHAYKQLVIGNGLLSKTSHCLKALELWKKEYGISKSFEKVRMRCKN